MIRLGSILVSLALLAGCASGPEPADLVLLNGKIATLWEIKPEATALAARGERIVAVGGDEDVEAYVGPDTEVIDLDGALAVPGLIEGHGHLLGLGESLMNVRVNDARTFDEVIERVAAAAKRAVPGEWIVGRGWHQEKWKRPPEPAVEGYPVHDALSAAVPDNPVFLRHASGHAALANAKAMELAGIDRSTPDPPGGRILRDARGRATGVFRETAAGLVGAVHAKALAERTPEQVRADQRAALERAIDACLANGLTSFQDAGSSLLTADVLREMADAGELDMRLWVMLRVPNALLERHVADYRMIDRGNGRLTVRALKRSIDGALGAHGAWLLEPYTDLPETSGLNTIPLDDLARTAQIAVEHDLQLCVHAIGDRGNRETLDLFERVFAETGRGADRRWRVEHAQHLNAADIPRFAELGVIASMQGVHCTSDGPWVPARLGDARAEEGAYVWRKLWDSGAVVTNGTDAPVEDVSPVASYYATVTRRMADGETFYPEQRLGREEALRSYTLNPAYAAFEEADKGSLEPGKLADVTVLSRDILTVPAEEIPGTEVLWTIVGGHVAYARK